MLDLDVHRLGRLYDSARYPDVKDPSVVFDGEQWHVFATGCGLPSGLEVAHATAPALDGPWTEQQPAVLRGVGMITQPAAPGVVAEGRVLHLFLQHDFAALDGAIEHLVSGDGGRSFEWVDTTLTSLPGTPEAGVYDPDPALVGGVPHLTYSAMTVVGQPDIHLARSTSGSWSGPWQRLGCILRHEEVEGHNQLGCDDYEWGLEGPQLVELPDGRVLLTAVCFLAAHRRGERQRLLLAVAERPEGPFEVLGPLVGPLDGGENGHGAAVVDAGTLRLVYQERAGEGRPWRILHATAPLQARHSRPGRPTASSRGDSADALVTA